MNTISIQLMILIISLFEVPQEYVSDNLNMKKMILFCGMPISILLLLFFMIFVWKGTGYEHFFTKFNKVIMLVIAILDNGLSIFVIYAIFDYHNDDTKEPMRIKLLFVMCLIKASNFYCISTYFYYGRNNYKDGRFTGHDDH